MYAPLWSQGARLAACNLLGAEHDVLRAHWTALDRAVEGEEAVLLARTGVESMLALLRHHFHNEEFFMRALRYPDFHRHKTNHQRLIGDFKYISNVLSETSEKWPRIFVLLNKWYLEHGSEHDERLESHVHTLISGDRLQ